jgi:voltage-gated potassium channel
MPDTSKKLILVAALILAMVTVGTGGYMILEGWNFLDALYMTVTTLTTVGYREVHELSTKGIVFTIILIVAGVGTVLYALSAVAVIFLEGALQGIFGRRKLEKKIQALKNHYIVCGYGRMGRIIGRELRAEGVPFVAIEKSPQISPEEGVLILQGDATQDAVLKEAGIERAKGLIAVLSSDAENLFVVLSARELNPQLLIVARALEEDAEKKLLRAGATKVISPYHIGGLRMAHTVLKPTLVDFIEFATKSGNIELQMQEIPVLDGSRLDGLTLQECGIGEDLGVVVIAVKQKIGEIRFNPTFGSTLKGGDTLIVLGEGAKLKAFEELARGKKP